MPGEQVYEQARVLGAAIAEAGWRLCNGGYGGTMEAACRGAVEAGGPDAQTIGVTCSAFGRKGANRWVRQEIATSNLNDRVARLIELGDAYVVLPGSTGTLLELAMVWELTNKRFITGKPIVLMGNFWQPVVETVAKDTPDAVRCIDQADEPQGVIRIIREHLGS
jgi:uncharacterized protein (TIGR00725 family)